MTLAFMLRPYVWRRFILMRKLKVGSGQRSWRRLRVLWLIRQIDEVELADPDLDQ